MNNREFNYYKATVRCQQFIAHCQHQLAPSEYLWLELKSSLQDISQDFSKHGNEILSIEPDLQKLLSATDVKAVNCLKTMIYGKLSLPLGHLFGNEFERMEALLALGQLIVQLGSTDQIRLHLHSLHYPPVPSENTNQTSPDTTDSLEEPYKTIITSCKQYIKLLEIDSRELFRDDDQQTAVVLDYEQSIFPSWELIERGIVRHRTHLPQAFKPSIVSAKVEVNISDGQIRIGNKWHSIDVLHARILFHIVNANGRAITYDEIKSQDPSLNVIPNFSREVAKIPRQIRQIFSTTRGSGSSLKNEYCTV